jgi:DNA-binding transcriptional LysR family regulator
VTLPDTFPDLVTLELFLSVVRTGSVSKAARANGVSQPSVSERMKILERKVGVPLLQRTSAGSQPTAAGALVAEWASSLLNQAEQVATSLASLRGGSAARLRIAASYTVAEYLLPTWLDRLRRAEPSIATELDVMNSSHVLERVTAGDVALGFVESPGWIDSLASLVVARDALVVIVAPTDPWARRRRPLTPSDLASTPLVLREEGSGTRDALVHALSTHDLTTCEPRLSLGSTSAIKSAVAAGGGAGVVSALAVESELRHGDVVAVAVEGLDLTRELRAVWRKDHPLTPAGKKLIDIATDVS